LIGKLDHSEYEVQTLIEIRA